MSGFPLSIGTSLAFESIFNMRQKPYDPDRKIPQHIDIGKYNTLWVNMATLYRNIMASLEKEEANRVHPQDVFTTLLEEINVIENLLQEEGKGCQVHFYHSDYKKLKQRVNSQKYKVTKLKEPLTDSQKFLANLMESVIKGVHDLQGAHYWFDDAIEPKHRDTSLVLTHLPYDLTSYKKFTDLHLLESNTGVLKERFSWSSKYHPVGKSDLSILPFHRKLLLIFGDKHQIIPGPLSLRKQILEIAEKRHWTPMTTLDKVKLDFSIDNHDPYTADVWNSLGE